ncbi:universal stress protein [Natranaeroarchaeum aerophilus]|uniref:Universal stress protein n=1 Tax=Natranaeroarchaeum aerophilus TaxID=2917711 RepID=A0AAE3K731_9EURY|nr:universal stress protein [Natranaeroarchaeum aerophilus]MCL9813434.1 universal stress protein [Natranaeroarchaeum aerophilus]
MDYLVATDGSAVSDTAIEHAARQAGLVDADLEIVHVLTPETELVDGQVVLPGEDAALEQGERILEQAETVAARAVTEADAAVQITTELLTGRPAESITTYADENGIEAIYVGHRGLSDKPDYVVGSVAKTVVDKTTVPVTIVK